VVVVVIMVVAASGPWQKKKGLAWDRFTLALVVWREQARQNDAVN